jgi:hypothetical protein
MSVKVADKYYLVHVVSADEFFTPLVQTQVFEQAYLQQNLEGVDRPAKVEVWVPLSARHFFSGTFHKYRKELQLRFHGLRIFFFPGIDRIKNFPRIVFMLLRRAFWGRGPVLFHFRSEKHLAELAPVKDFFSGDKFVADIRGIWAAEKLLLEGVEVWDLASLMKHDLANQIVLHLRRQLGKADGISAVSSNLLNWVQSLSHEVKEAWVVPCCNNVPDQLADNYFEDQQQLKAICQIPPDALVVGYLGGTAPYQNLEDMVLPLMQECLLLDSRCHALIITHEMERMKKLLAKAGLDETRVSIISLPQQQVSRYLKIFDLGLLVRHENLVNKVAQPVKLGEYLAAGVPVCVEGNIGGFAQAITERNAGVIVSVARNGLKKSAESCIAYLSSNAAGDRVKNAFQLARDHFAWEKNLRKHRVHYRKLLTAE